MIDTISPPDTPSLLDKINFVKRRTVSMTWKLIKDLPYIQNVQIQTHSRCNANCIYCPYIESEHARNPGKMSDELFEHILENLLPFRFGINRGKIAPYLMQEPLLDPKIFERIEKIYRYFPKTLVEVSTNAAALNETRINDLLETFPGRKHEIWISHHGIDKESMENIMMIDYEKATRNLLNLLRKSKNRLKIRIIGAGASINNETVFFTKEQYFDYWKHNLSSQEFEDVDVKVWYHRFIDRACNIKRTERKANLLNIDFRRKIDKQHPFHCSRVDNWIHFMYDGTIRICCMDYHGEVKLPNIREISLVEYYRSREYREMVDMVSGKMESEDDFICKRCLGNM